MPKVRFATSEDLDTLVAFSICLAKESENRRLDPDTVRAGIRHLLGDPQAIVLVALDDDGRAVGEMMIGGREWSEWSDGQFWWVTSVYVRPDSRGRGHGHSLYRRVRELAHADALRVLGLRGCVNSDNTKAQPVLARLGRSANGYLVFEEML